MFLKQDVLLAIHHFSHRGAVFDNCSTSVSLRRTSSLQGLWLSRQLTIPPWSWNWAKRVQAFISACFNQTILHVNPCLHWQNMSTKKMQLKLGFTEEKKCAGNQSNHAEKCPSFSCCRCRCRVNILRCGGARPLASADYQRVIQQRS